MLHVRELEMFAEQCDFQQVASSPPYAQSNWKAEKGVHIFKQLLKKAADSHSDPYFALLILYLKLIVKAGTGRPIVVLL